MIVNESQVNKEISHVHAVEAEENGPSSFSYLRLTDADFELLCYSLYKTSAPANTIRNWDDTAIMVRGADAGRDVILTATGRLVGVVQCKRLESAITLPAVFREISKLILFAKVTDDVTLTPSLTYTLALARDPASTVVNFFARRTETEDKRKDDLLAAAREVREEYATLSALSEAQAEAEVQRVFPLLSLKLLRPGDFDEWLGRQTNVSARFFRQRLVIDATQMAQGQQEIMDFLRSISGKIEEVSSLSDKDLKTVKAMMENTPEEYRLNLGVASLFGYPREMFAENGKLRLKLQQLMQIRQDFDNDYIQWIFARSRSLADEICETAEVMFTVHPFARQVPKAFLGLIALECSEIAVSGRTMAKINKKTTPAYRFENDTQRLDFVFNDLIEAGRRYLVGDFTKLAGDAALIALKRQVINGMMVGLTSTQILEKRLQDGLAVLKPKLDAAAQKLRDAYSFPTSIFLMGTGFMDHSDAMGRMAETAKALDALMKINSQMNESDKSSPRSPEAK